MFQDWSTRSLRTESVFCSGSVFIFGLKGRVAVAAESPDKGTTADGSWTWTCPCTIPIFLLAHSRLSAGANLVLYCCAGLFRRQISHPATISLSQLYTLNPKRELNARFGVARREYVVDKLPVRGVRVSVRVYGNVDMAGAWEPFDAPAPGPGAVVVVGGSVVKRRPVERPTTRETGE